MSIGVPIKVFHEAVGHVVTIETTVGELFRGKLTEAEDNMNCLMSNITVTYRDGRTAQLEQVYIRGSKIRFVILPDMIKNAPMFKNMKTGKAAAAAQGRGKAAIIRASVNKAKANAAKGGPGSGSGGPGGAGGPPGGGAPGAGGPGGAAGTGRSRGTNVYQKK